MTQKYSNSNKKYINNNNNIIDKTKLSMMIMLAGLITFINNACEKEHIINDKTEQNNNNNGNKPNPTPNPQPTPDKTISFEEALNFIIDSTKKAQNDNLAKIKAEYEKIKDKELIIKSNGNLFYDSLQSILFNRTKKRVKLKTNSFYGYIKKTSVLNRLMKGKQENATTDDKVKAGFIYFNNKLNNTRTYTLSKETLESYNKDLLDYLSNSEMLRLYNDNKDSTTLIKNRDELKQYLMNFYKELENSNLEILTVTHDDYIPLKQYLEILALYNKDSIDLLLAGIIKNYEYYGSDSYTSDSNEENRAKLIESMNKCLEYKAYQKMINKAQNKKKRNK